MSGEGSTLNASSIPKNVSKEDGEGSWCGCCSAGELGTTLVHNILRCLKPILLCVSNYFLLSLDWKLCLAVPGDEDVCLAKQVTFMSRCKMKFDTAFLSTKVLSNLNESSFQLCTDG